MKCGDIIRIDDLEQVPADCILLKVEDQKPEAFVKTAALDGERNLKPKIAIKEVQDNLVNLVTGEGSDIIVEVNCKTSPKPDLYSFDADLKLVTKN